MKKAGHKTRFNELLTWPTSPDENQLKSLLLAWWLCRLIAV